MDDFSFGNICAMFCTCTSLLTALFLVRIIKFLCDHIDKFIKGLPWALLMVFFYACIRFSMPRCYIQNIYVPALDKFDNSTSITTGFDNTIFLDLRLENALDHKGVHFDDIHLTLFYTPEKKQHHRIGTSTIPGFYFGGGKKTERNDVVFTYGVPWNDASTIVSLGSPVGFRLELVTKVKFKYCLIYSNKRKLANGANVNIDDSGRKITHKDIRLTSSATSNCGGYLSMAKTLVLASILLTVLL